MVGISLELLRRNFYPVLEHGDIIRCTDELRDRDIYTYFHLTGTTSGTFPFMVSDGLSDDVFAAAALAAAGIPHPDAFQKIALPGNGREFTHALLVPPSWHNQLAGRLDRERENTLWLVPIFECEFSGMETPEEFHAISRIVATTNWARDVTPLIKLRFDNPNTGGGTGDDYVFAGFAGLDLEIANLIGAAQGFIEIINHRGAVLELFWAGAEDFTVIRDRRDADAKTLNHEAARDEVWTMLVESDP